MSKTTKFNPSPQVNASIYDIRLRALELSIDAYAKIANAYIALRSSSTPITDTARTFEEYLKGETVDNNE